MAERTIVAKLLATSAVTAIAGTAGVKPIQVRQTDALPCITYQVIDRLPLNHSTGATNTGEMRLQVDCWAASYGGAKALASVVRSALSGYSNTGASVPVTMTHLLSEQDLPDALSAGQDELTHRVSFDFLVEYGTT